MPMEREKHENLLSELLNPEIEHSRRTEILQEIRIQNDTDIHDFSENTSKADKLSRDNSDLVISNSKLFRQLGVTGDNKEDDKKIVEKEFSETITLEQLEKGF